VSLFTKHTTKNLPLTDSKSQNYNQETVP